MSIHHRRETEKYAFLLNAMDFFQENEVIGDYFEFGCHQARTFKMALSAARQHEIEAMQFYAFDSFQGLPKINSGPVSRHRKEGAFSTSENEFRDLINQHGIYVDRVHTVAGFYDKSLTCELRTEFGGRRAGLVTIDCDLYESAKPVLEFIEPFLQEGTVIYIDDFLAGYGGSPAKGVALAFEEFRAKSNWQYSEFMSVGWYGRSFVAYK